MENRPDASALCGKTMDSRRKFRQHILRSVLPCSVFLRVNKNKAKRHPRPSYQAYLSHLRQYRACRQVFPVYIPDRYGLFYNALTCSLHMEDRVPAERNWTDAARAVTMLESMPPDKNVQTGTSDTICRFTVSRMRKDTCATVSL